MMHTRKRSFLAQGFLLVAFILNLILIFPATFFAQGEDVILINGREIDTLRYIEFQDSPYQFSDWPKGNVITNNFHRFYDIKLNYNGYTGEFEVRRKDEYIELDAGHYIRIEVPVAHTQDTLLFQRGLMPGKPETFVQLLHFGDDYLFFKKYDVELKTVSSRTVGGLFESKRFIGQYKYYLMSDGAMRPIKLKKKKIVQLFAKPKAIEQLIAQERINCAKEEEVIRLFGLLEQTESQY